MEFIELTGRTLRQVIQGQQELLKRLDELGVGEDSILRVNRQGDIELRRADRWDVIGGLLGEFETRLCQLTGLDWLRPI